MVFLFLQIILDLGHQVVEMFGNLIKYLMGQAVDERSSDLIMYRDGRDFYNICCGDENVEDEFLQYILGAMDEEASGICLDDDDDNVVEVGVDDLISQFENVD